MRCPLLNKPCIEKECAFWAEFTMRDTVTQKVTVEYSCVIPRLPLMLVELIKNTGGVQAATEEVRNRMEHVVTNGEVQTKIFAGLAELSLQRASLKELAGGGPEGK